MDSDFIFILPLFTNNRVHPSNISYFSLMCHGILCSDSMFHEQGNRALEHRLNENQVSKKKKQQKKQQKNFFHLGWWTTTACQFGSSENKFAVMV